MTDIRALMFADWCALRANAKRILRSPGRSALWGSYALSIVALSVGRAFGFGHSGPSNDLRAGADYLLCTILITLIYSLASGRAAIALFRTRAEARFIIGSPVRAPIAIAYLQLREALSAAFRYFFALIYFIFILAPRSVGVLTAIADIVLVVGIFIASATLAVVRRLLGTRAGIACTIAGVPLGILAAAPIVRDAVVQLPAYVPAGAAAWILAAIPPWHPGRILLAPDLRSFAAVTSFVLAGVFALAAAGRDAYPELYAFAVARLELREFARRPASRTALAAMRRPLIEIPTPGPLAFVWKSVVEFRRRVRPAYSTGGAVLLVMLGFVAARRLPVRDGVFDSVIGLLVNFLIFSGTGLAARLGSELRRPLFWLAPDRLFERLCGLALGQIWQRALASVLAGAGYGLGGGSLDRVMLFAFGIPALVVLITATGFAAFALSPNAADQRGPVIAVRSFAALFLLVPPGVVYIVAGTFGAPRTALIGATLLALVESGCLIGFAAWRLDGRIDRVPA